MRALADKIVALHDALVAAGLPHAFGGALALAYCVLEPRATKDIDVNVFIDTSRIKELLAGLPSGVTSTKQSRHLLARDAQARFFWGETPVDIFLSNHPFHHQAAANVRHVPFGSDEIPVLACADLAVFKAFFDRPKDAVDVATMVTAGAIRIDSLEETVEALLGQGERDRFFTRVREFAAES